MTKNDASYLSSDSAAASKKPWQRQNQQHDVATGIGDNKKQTEKEHGLVEGKQDTALNNRCFALIERAMRALL